MNRLFRLFRLLPIPALACAIALLTGAASFPSEQLAPSDGVSEANLRAHIEYLASEKLQGRLAGSAGAKMAADYIAEKARSFKLAPPPGLNSLRQQFSLISAVKLGENNSLEVTIPSEGGDAERVFVPSAGVDLMPVGFTANATITSSVIFAGYGISSKEPAYDDYAGMDASGKVVLVLRTSPDGDDPHSPFSQFLNLRFKAINAREKGAKGLLVIAENPEFQNDTLARLTFDNVGGDAGIPVAAINRNLAEEMLRANGLTLADVQRKIDSTKKPASVALKRVEAALTCEVEKETAQTDNILGWMEGSDPKLKDQFIVIGAHYDHLGRGGPNSLAPKSGEVHHGADDNASGTAAVLELARMMSKQKRPRRSVLFAWFSGEEEGLLGSANFVKNPPLPLSRIAAMINLDMVGRMRNNSLIIGGAGTSAGWKPMLGEINKNHHLELKFQDDGYGPSDHASFYKENIPVLFFFTGVHEDYHRPSDTADKINAAGEAKIVDYARKVVQNIDAMEAAPVFTKAGPAQQPQGRGFRVSLGTIPDYAAEIEGVKLTGVREGSPAEKAGIKGGDIIVKVGSREIKNVYDYTYALGDLEAGKEVEMVVIRSGQRLTLRVTPEKR